MKTKPVVGVAIAAVILAVFLYNKETGIKEKTTQTSQEQTFPLKFEKLPVKPSLAQ